MYRVVDLGTKKAAALVEFRKRCPTYMRDRDPIPPERCLGLDLKAEYADEVTRHGFEFRTDDVLTFDFPPADYYLAWDFLEHLPSLEAARSVIRRMANAARRGLWFRLPSFEQDTVTGEGRLRQRGLRFTWTNWAAHPTAVLVQDVINAVGRIPSELRGNVKIATSADHRVVPIDAPADVQRYERAHGPKPSYLFTPPVIGQWDMIYRLP